MSSSDLSPVSNVIDGLIVTGGIGRTVNMNHSGLANSGSNPSNATSLSVIFSNLVLISVGGTFLSFSMNVDGFSNFTGYCLALQ